MTEATLHQIEQATDWLGNAKGWLDTATFETLRDTLTDSAESGTFNVIMWERMTGQAIN